MKKFRMRSKSKDDDREACIRIGSSYQDKGLFKKEIIFFIIRIMFYILSTH